MMRKVGHPPPNPVTSNFLAFAYPKLLTLIGVAVFAGFVATLWFQQTGASAPLSWLAIAVSWAAGVGVFLFARTIPCLGRLISSLGWPSSRFSLVLAGGIALRLIVALTLSPQPTSDARTYLALAHQLIQTGSYGSPGARAYWPPGLPLVLALLMWPGLSSKAALLFYGILCYVAAACGTKRLAEHMGLQECRFLPAWLLALWPTHVLYTGLPEKELLLIALFPWTVHFAILAMRGSAVSASLAGLLTGAAILVQPSLQLLPFAMIGFALLVDRRFAKVLSAGLLGIASTALVVAPWTIRNYQVLRTPVLVSTNGGYALYRANNENATGAYTPKGAIDLGHLDELSLDRESARLASEWIRSHPAKFVQLSIGKMLLFLGDDSGGAYAAIRRGRPDIPNLVYLAVRLLSALPWLAIWFLVLVSLRPPWPHDEHEKVLATWIALLPLLYLLSIHVIFESGPKYHVPLLPLVLLISGLCFERLLRPTP